MSGFNKVVLMGNLTRDPELRKTPAGQAVLDLGLAVNEAYKNAAGELVEKACFVDVVTWGRQAETCGQYLRKGRPILVEGRLQLDQWQTEGGEKRSRIRVRAERVQFLSSGPGGGGGAGGTGGAVGAGGAGSLRGNPVRDKQATGGDDAGALGASPAEEPMPF